MLTPPKKAVAAGYRFGPAGDRCHSLLMVTMIGLINANLMTLEQAIGVMMGQEIGTTLTAQIIAFKIGDFCFLFLLRNLERISDHADNLGISVMRA